MHLARASALLAGLLGLASCVQPVATGPGTVALGSQAPQAGGAPAPPAGSRVALLAPLTGPNAGVAQGIVNAAKLGLGATAATSLDVLDTGGTPQGAAAAAQKAIADGAGVILGPLTAPEAAAVAPITQPAHVTVLAFTSDATQARSGLWTLGITPAQQVHVLIQAATAQGHGQIAALLPETPLGLAMSQALTQEGGASGPTPTVQTYGGSFSSMNDALRSLSDYAGRRGPIDAQIKQLRTAHTAAARQEAEKLERQGVPPAPFSALLIAETASGLGELSSLLPYYDVNNGPVLFLGPGLWAANPGAIATAGFSGALYAAPDPTASTPFVSSYSAAYGAPPSPLDGLAFDAGAIARVTTADGRVNPAALTNPQGFSGADGVLVLLPDGAVKRGLAVFRVQSGGSQIVQPAPQSLTMPGS